MKFYKIVILVFLFIYPLNANESDLDNITDDILSITSESLESVLNNIGRGDTEVTIGGSELTKPFGSIMIVRPIIEFDKSIVFNQTQVNNYFIRGKNRLALNLGLGYRKMSEDKTYFLGSNIFLDIDSEENLRSSLGLEFKSSPFAIAGNYYQHISGVKKVGDFDERVLDGYDLNIHGQVPFLPWLDLTYTNYKWKKEKNVKNSKGNKVGLEIYFMDNIDLVIGLDKNNIDGDTWYGNIVLRYPENPRLSMIKNFEEGKLISDVAFQESDISKELLSKVSRSNRITIESEGSGVVISRAVND